MNNLKRKRYLNLKEKDNKECKITAEKNKIHLKFQRILNNKKNNLVTFILETKINPKDKMITETVLINLSTKRKVKNQEIWKIVDLDKNNHANNQFLMIIKQ